MGGRVAESWFLEVCEDARDLTRVYPEGVSAWSLMDYYGFGYRTALGIISGCPFRRPVEGGPPVRWAATPSRDGRSAAFPKIGGPVKLMWPAQAGLVQTPPLPMLYFEEAALLLALWEMVTVDRVWLDGPSESHLAAQLAWPVERVQAGLGQLVENRSIAEIVGLVDEGLRGFILIRDRGSINQDMRDFVAGRGVRHDAQFKRDLKKQGFSG